MLKRNCVQIRLGTDIIITYAGLDISVDRSHLIGGCQDPALQIPYERGRLSRTRADAFWGTLEQIKLHIATLA